MQLWLRMDCNPPSCHGGFKRRQQRLLLQAINACPPSLPNGRHVHFKAQVILASFNSKFAINVRLLLNRTAIPDPYSRAYFNPSRKSTSGHRCPRKFMHRSVSWQETWSLFTAVGISTVVTGFVPVTETMQNLCSCALVKVN